MHRIKHARLLEVWIQTCARRRLAGQPNKQGLRTCSTLLGSRSDTYSVCNQREKLLSRMYSRLDINNVILSRNLAQKQSQVFIEFVNESREKDDFALSVSEWEDFASKILEEESATGFRYCPFEFPMMKSAFTQKKPELAKSLMKYCTSKNIRHSGIIVMYMNACVDKYEDEVLEEFDKIKDDPSIRMLYLFLAIQAIAKTSEWKKCVAMLEDLDKLEPLGAYRWTKCRLYILEAALRHRDFYMVCDISQKINFPYYMEGLTDLILKTCINKAYDIDLLLELLKVCNCTISTDQAEELKTLCNKNNGNVLSYRRTVVYRDSGMCSCCRKELTPGNDFTTEEFEELKEALMDHSVRGTNMYRNTTAEELTHFMELIKKYGPFDLVIDYQNIFYRLKEYYIFKKGRSNVYRQLAEAIGVDKRVLFTTKRFPDGSNKHSHMAPVKIKLSPVAENHYSMHLDSRSHDDKFLLLAAFLSGPHCYIMTNDHLRDHIGLLDEKNKMVFRKWQENRQIGIKFRRFDDSFMTLLPCTYPAQEALTGWHIQLQKEKYGDFYCTSNSYVCIRKLNYKPSQDLLEFRRVRKEFEKSLK